MALMCEICGKRPAELIVGENRPDSTRTLHLCGYCAAGKGIRVRVDLSQDPRQLWRRFLSRHLKEAEESSALACPSCGRTYMNFEETGSLGCPDCYSTFRGDMVRILKEYHGSDEHGGKVPFREQRRIAVRQRSRGAREALQMAISEERFEDAARLRDEIKDLEEEIGRLQEES
jgi:protein arginine kinase activator